MHKFNFKQESVGWFVIISGLIFLLTSCYSFRPISEVNPDYDAFCNSYQVDGEGLLGALYYQGRLGEVTFYRLRSGRDTVQVLDNPDPKVIAKVEFSENQGRIYKINTKYLQNIGDELARTRYVLIILSTINYLSGSGRSEDSQYVGAAEYLPIIVNAVYGDNPDLTITTWTDTVHDRNSIENIITFSNDMMILNL